MRDFAFTLFFADYNAAAGPELREGLIAAGYRLLENGGWDLSRNAAISIKDDAGTGYQLALLDKAVAAGIAEAEHRFQADPSSLDPDAALQIRVEEMEGDPVQMLGALSRLALTLSEHCLAIHWGGADTLMARDWFCKMVPIWLDGGAFPGIGLAALERSGDKMVSVGLDFLVGQEITVLPEAESEPTQQARLALRVIDFLVREGPIHVEQMLEVEGFGLIKFMIDENKGNINLTR